MDSLTIFTEYFDRKERLIGVGYETHGAVRATQYWWEGQPVSMDRWNKSRGALFKNAFEKEGKSQTEISGPK